MRGKPIPPPIHLSPEQTDYCIALYHEGKALRFIETAMWDAYRLKVGRMTVRKILLNHGVRMRNNRYDRHGGSPQTRYERISFFVPQEHKRALARLARSLDYGTVSEYVRAILRSEIERREELRAQKHREAGAAAEASAPVSGTASQLESPPPPETPSVAL